MPDIRIDEADDRLLIRGGDAVLAEYVFRPTDVRLESPRPYFSPIRTLGGEVVSLFRPHDHVWHKGIAWSLPVVDDENFWGGPTFVRGEGYVQLPNNGEQRHRDFDERSDAATGARRTERLDWVTEGGQAVFEEERTIAATMLANDGDGDGDGDGDDAGDRGAETGPDAWLLAFETRLRNVSGRAIPIGSPTTRGRENAGYGGLFWRGPRSFTNGTVLAPGVAGGDELRGIRAPWMGFSGLHDGTGTASTVVMVDHAANVQHPPQWFARSEDFACLCPAPFFSEEHVVESGATLELRYGVVIADGASDPERAQRLAARGAAALDTVLGTA
ncbi:PmoA family protein [Agromyces salentinus]|uniref:PmoA family protein n=1 Tax=Agromyces salentinus TaxID=269421 RepID=A0ABN2MDT7_9MICO|nr:PmoA family protein [Agromyces salentinus]